MEKLHDMETPPVKHARMKKQDAPETLLIDKQQQVEKLIEEYIRAGNWKMHERLPPERQLALSLGVSRNTLRTALQALQGRGILGTRRGSGTFVEAIPEHGLSNSKMNTLAGIDGLALLLPPVVGLCATKVKPSDLLELEKMLSPVGLAVHHRSATEFATVQKNFLYALVRVSHNAQISAALSRLIPQGKFFSEVMSTLSDFERETLFACMASMLGAVRKMEPEAASSSAERYASTLAEYCRRYA